MPLIEFYLTGAGETLKLPVNPPEVQIDSQVRTLSFASIDLGEFSMARGNLPARFSFESFFPGVDRQGDPLFPDWRHPLDYVAILGQWKANATTLQLLVTESEITGWSCYIEAFNRRDPTGAHGDVWYTLNLVEKRDLRLYTEAELAIIAREQDEAAAAAASAIALQRAPIDRPQTYTTGEGETLWELARRFYDDGARWADIWRANLEVLGADPNPPITPGTELRLP
jgi:LysM domain